jgi:AcrR family transcriptional regulator
LAGYSRVISTSPEKKPMFGKRTPVRRRERKKQATRDAIFAVAQKLFNEKGFENTAIEDITEKIDIAQSTFFNYFPRKEDVLVEIFKKKIPFLRKKCQEIVSTDAPMKTKINKVFAATARIAAQNQEITRAILLKNLSSFNNKEYNGLFFDDFRQSLSLIIEKGQQQGHMRSDVPALKLATMLEGVFTLFIIDCLIKKSYSMTSEDLFHRLDLVLEGMIKPDGPAA